MRYLYLMMVLPILSAQAAPDCSRLKVIAEDLEKKIQSKLLEKCDEIKPEDLGLSPGSPGFDKGPEDYRCRDFSIIDQQLKSVENERAMIIGILKLKEQIKTGLAQVTNQNLDKAKGATQNFMQNLRVAANMEALLLTNDEKSENILAKVVNDPNGWAKDDKTSLEALINSICKDFKTKSPVSVCGSTKYTLDEATFKELQAFLLLGKNSKKFDKKHVKDLRDALEIKKGEEPYSYTHLLAEIKNPGENVLSTEDIAKLKALPALANGDSGYNFLKQIRQSVKDLKDSEGIVQAQDIPERFSTLVSDLKRREEWELKSKLSYFLHRVQDRIPEDLKPKCDGTRELAGDVSAVCLDPLAKTLQGGDKALLEQFSFEMKYGQGHISKLDDALKRCIPKADLSFEAGCEEVFKNFTDKQEKLKQKALMLQALRARHIQATPELMAMRNFALEKLLAGECSSKGDAEIRCELELESISKEAVALGSATGEIIHVLENPEIETDVEGICDKGQEKIAFKEELCELQDEDPEQKSMSQFEKDSYDAPVDANTPDRSGESYLAAGQTLLSAVAGFFAPKPQPYINPYMSNMNPYPIVAKPQDISQKIMTPYIAGGFGSYFPTPGLRPYSSIGSNVGTYSAYDMGSGKLFNSPVGW